MWMQAMHDYGGTITFAPNFAYALAAKRSRDKDLEGLDLSKLRIAGCGAEPINPQVMRAFAERFGRVGFKPERADAVLRHGRGDARDQLPRARHADDHRPRRRRARCDGARPTPAAAGEDSARVGELRSGVPRPRQSKIVDEDGHATCPSARSAKS